jgi:hypothetical protein
LIIETVFVVVVSARPTNIVPEVVGETTRPEMSFRIGIGSIPVNRIEEIDILEKLKDIVPGKEIASTANGFSAEVQSSDPILSSKPNHHIDWLVTDLLSKVNVQERSFVVFY